MRMGWIGMAAVLALVPAWAPARAASVDLSRLDRDAAGPRTQVLVLGSVHLSQEMPKEFDPAWLRPLLDRLAAFHPDIVAVEAIPGEGCDMMQRHPKAYAPEDVAHYCPDTADTRAALGLDRPEALAQIAAALRDWPAAPTPTQRRRLAALFLAAGEPASAVAQWLQLEPAERHAGDGLDAKLVARLGKYETSRDESIQIGARLAARLGLQRVYGMDDHSGDNLDVGDGRAFLAAIQQAWDAAAPSVRDAQERIAALSKGQDPLALYRFMNDPARLQKAALADAGAALRDRSPEHYGQQYVGGWETRNLRMAANIRASYRQQPGARVLTVVGAMHKPWLDSYLGQMQNTDIVDVQKVLAEPAR